MNLRVAERVKEGGGLPYQSERRGTFRWPKESVRPGAIG